jgi:DNA-binding CsgD family transcriptional regulator
MAKALTAHQQKIWDLHTGGKPRQEIADEMNLSVNNVSKTLTIIRRKLGITAEIAKKLAAEGSTLEHKKPEQVAALIDGLTDPFKKIKDACDAAGLPSGVSDRLLKRMKAKYQGVTREVRRMKSHEIAHMLEDKILMMGDYLDDQVVAAASARDLALGMSALIEKRALLRGEPTAIISDHERKKLNELGPAMLEALKRRGIAPPEPSIEGQFTREVTVEPVRTDA